LAAEPALARDAEEETASLWPEEAAPAAAAEPEARPTIRIIDPAVAEEDDLYLQPAAREPAPAPVPPEPRQETKKGWLSLFGGRPRYDAPPAPPPVSAPSSPPPRAAVQRSGGAQPALQAEPEPLDATEDLDIPSFLRRLAN